MYALIATHNAALRSAITVLLRICHPGCIIVAVADVAELHEHLEAGLCDTSLVDTQFDGYGAAFDVDMLRGYYPHVNFLPLASGGASHAMLDALQDGLTDHAHPPSTMRNAPRPEHPAARHAASGQAGLSQGRPGAATSVDHLLRAIQVIGSGDMIAHPPRVTPSQPTSDAGPALTARQRDVLQLLGEGRSTKDIARRLGLAVPTVKTHLAALYRQLGARNRVEAVVKSGMSRGDRPNRSRQGNPGLAFGDSAFLYGSTAS